MCVLKGPNTSQGENQMNQKIYPHQYHALHQQINDLINAYQSVNDLQTIQVY